MSLKKLKELYDMQPTDNSGPCDPLTEHDIRSDNICTAQYIIENLTDFAEPIIYINSDLVDSEVAIKAIELRCRMAHPEAQEFIVERLNREDLQISLRGKTPAAERSLLSRGYFCSLESDVLQRGESLHDNAFFERNRAASDFHLAILVALLPGVRPAPSAKISNAVRDVIAPWVNDRPERGEREFQLVRTGEIYRPALGARCGEDLMEVHHSSLKQALENGRRDPLSFALARHEDLHEQVHRETIGAQDFFGCNSSVVYTWQTQVLALLLRATAWSKIRSGEQYRKFRDELLQSAEELLRNRNAPHSFSYITLSSEAAESAANADEGFKSELAKGFGLFSVMGTLTLEETGIAALHGSTFGPAADSHVTQRGAPLLELMHWLGHLKRRRHNRVTRRIAWMIIATFDGIKVEGDEEDLENTFHELHGHRHFVEGRLAPNVWAELLEISRRIVSGDSEGHDLAYEWARNREQAWQVLHVDEGTIISGPLLDFPLNDAAKWERLTHSISADAAARDDLLAFANAMVRR